MRDGVGARACLTWPDCRCTGTVHPHRPLLRPPFCMTAGAVGAVVAACGVPTTVVALVSGVAERARQVVVVVAAARVAAAAAVRAAVAAAVRAAAAAAPVVAAVAGAAPAWTPGMWAERST